MALDARLRLAMRKQRIDDDTGEIKPQVSMCFCGGWPHLNRVRDRIFIRCSRCGLKGDLVDDFDLDGAIDSWNKAVEEVKEVFGGF